MTPAPGRAKGFLSSDLTAPAVVITNPANGANIFGVINLQATATDVGSGVKSVQWKVDGVNYGGVQTISPFTQPFDPSGYTIGNHTVTAVVTDNANRTSSSSITISVQSSRLKDVTQPTPAGTQTAANGGIYTQFSNLNVDQWGDGIRDGVTFYVPWNGTYSLYYQVRQPGYGVFGWPSGWSGTGSGAAWFMTNRYGQLGTQSWGPHSDVSQNNWMTCTASVFLFAGDWIQCWTNGDGTGLAPINYDMHGQFTRTGP